MAEEGRCNSAKIPLLVVVGPTAVGKTGLSIKLARRLNGEIVSADSVQVYRNLDIGSAKPTVEERERVPHHLLDVVDPDVNYTVYDYQRDARRCIKSIHRRGKLPVLTGGTGFYIKAVVDRYALTGVKAHPGLRRRLQKEAELKGGEDLYRRLAEIDPLTASRVHPNDLKRIIRALEYYYQTGKPISEQEEMTAGKAESEYNLHMFGLYMRRDKLYERINRRVEEMIRRGLLEEVEGLLEKGYGSGHKSMQSLGYRHMIKYLEGEWSWEQAVELFKRDTRRYAKRQLTWFRADNRIRWYELHHPKDFDTILEKICSQVEGD